PPVSTRGEFLGTRRRRVEYCKSRQRKTRRQKIDREMAVPAATRPACARRKRRASDKIESLLRQCLRPTRRRAARAAANFFRCRIPRLKFWRGHSAIRTAPPILAAVRASRDTTNSPLQFQT